MLLLKRNVFASVVVAAILVSLLSVFVSTKAHATPDSLDDVRNGTYTFVRRNHIRATISGRNYDFYDSNPFNNTNEYVMDSAQTSCNFKGKIWFGDGDTITRQGAQGSPSTWVTANGVDIDVGPACSAVDTVRDIRVNANELDVWFYWQNNLTIILVGDGANPRNHFVRSSPDSRVFVQQGESTCADKLLLSGETGVRIYRMHPSGDGWGDVSDADLALLQPGSCKLHDGDGRDVGGEQDPPSNNGLYRVGDFQNSSLLPADNPAPSGGVFTEEENSCEGTSGVLGWIMCPVAGVLDSAVGFLDEQIRAMLIVDKDSYLNDEGDGGRDLRQAWVQIRNIAYIVLIPIMLVMVIGTALGFEVFSAYTIKKALPRMALAVIFITLSWYICVFLVEFFNVVGSGIKGLITSPFTIDQTTSPLKAALGNAGVIATGDSNNLESYASGIVAGTGAGIIVAGAFAMGALSLGIVMSTLGTAALVLGGIFLLLIARQMIIIALLLVAPLAIIAWIFPGNDKMWKLWWGSFSKLLMLYPLIMLLLGVGEIFAHVTGTARAGAGDNQLITVIIVIAAFIMPFFFIPFAFKWAGGVFGNLAGMINDKERGVLDRLKKGRGEKRAQGWQGFKAGTGTGAFQKNRFARGAGTRLGAGIGGGKGVFGYGAKGRARMDQMNRENAVGAVMKNPAWNGVNQDDNALHAGILMEDMSKQEAINHLVKNRGLSQAEAERATAAWQASGLGGRAAAVAAAQQLVSTGTGYKDMRDMSQTLARASGGNTSTATALAGFANSETKKVGRNDLAPSFSALDRMVQADLAGNGAVYDDIRDEDGNVTQYSPQRAQAIEAAWNSGSLYSLANGKPKAMQEFANHWTQQYQQGLDSGNADQTRKAARALAEMEQMIPNATGDNAEIIRKAVGQSQSTENGHVASSGSSAGVVGTPSTPEETAESYRRTEQAQAQTRQEIALIKAEARKGARVYERPDPNRLNES